MPLIELAAALGAAEFEVVDLVSLAAGRAEAARLLKVVIAIQYLIEY